MDMKAELGSFDLDQGNVRGSNEIKEENHERVWVAQVLTERVIDG